MKTIVWILTILLLIIAAFYTLNTYIYNEKQAEPTVENHEVLSLRITPIGHATAVLEWENSRIIVDPVGTSSRLMGASSTDIVLVTDIHGDHLSTSTLERIVGEATLIVPKAVYDLLPTSLASRAQVLQNDETTSIQGFTVKAIPMYNLPESEDSRHTKGRGNGYIIERNGSHVYFAGDTDGTPEMRALTNIDIAFIPMNPPFTMDIEEAADAVLEFKPRQVYPYHYRGQDGLSDVNKFADIVQNANPDIQVVLLDWYSGI
ncbi:MAG TPA: MBL fold metallo-hydrolase [Candidatus Paceibacterota bacterium]|nr:MBL fold metallo-hydrolase [Candidatus Paceibacterota bacterium]